MAWSKVGTTRAGNANARIVVPLVVAAPADPPEGSLVEYDKGAVSALPASKYSLAIVPTMGRGVLLRPVT